MVSLAPARAIGKNMPGTPGTPGNIRRFSLALLSRLKKRRFLTPPIINVGEDATSGD